MEMPRRFGATRAELLDVRPASVARARPILSAANIPLNELPEAAGELPPRADPVRIAETGPEAEAAVQVLAEMERSPIAVCDFRYGSNLEPLRLWEPNEFLVEVLANLDPGRAFDFACGGGREAAAMAYFGWTVTGIDILPDALERAACLATRFGVAERIQWRRMDLTRVAPGENAIDLATMFFYLDRPLIRSVIDRLAPGGTLLLETFTPTHRKIHGRPSRKELVITAEEMAELAGDLQLAVCEEGHRSNGRHTCRFRGVGRWYRWVGR